MMGPRIAFPTEEQRLVEQILKAQPGSDALIEGEFIDSHWASPTGRLRNSAQQLEWPAILQDALP